MKHYTEDEWLKFNRCDLPLEKRFFMEEHLRECDQCLAVFLGLVDGGEVAGAAELVPPDFTPVVMRMIGAGPGQTPRRVRRKSEVDRARRQNLLVYYAAAAVLTLAFLGGGVFQSLVRSYPEVARAAGRGGQKMEEKWVVNLSDRIAGRTFQWLCTFENKNREGSR